MIVRLPAKINEKCVNLKKSALNQIRKESDDVGSTLKYYLPDYNYPQNST